MHGSCNLEDAMRGNRDIIDKGKAVISYTHAAADMEGAHRFMTLHATNSILHAGVDVDSDLYNERKRGEKDFITTLT